MAGKTDEKQVDVKLVKGITDELRKLSDKANKDAAKNDGPCADLWDDVQKADRAVKLAGAGVVAGGVAGGPAGAALPFLAMIDAMIEFHECMDKYIKCLDRNRDASKSEHEKRLKKSRDLLAQLVKEKKRVEKGK